MKRFRSLLPLGLILMSTNLLAQNPGAEAQAKAREDSARARRAQIELEREARREHKSSAARREDARILEERAQAMAEAARESVEALEVEELEARVQLAAELAAEAVENLEEEGLTGGFEHLGEAFEHMELSGLAGLQGLKGLGALAELQGLVDIPPFPAIAPLPAIPPIGPLLPHAPMLAEGVIWGDEGHGASRQYRQYLSEDEQTRLNALRSLLCQEEKLALPEVKNFMQEKNWAMRAAALELLAEADNREAVSILREALQRETDNRVKRATFCEGCCKNRLPCCPQKDNRGSAQPCSSRLRCFAHDPEKRLRKPSVL